MVANARGALSDAHAIESYVRLMREQFERDVLMLQMLYREHPQGTLAALFRADIITRI